MDSVWSTYYQRIVAFDRFSQICVAVQHKLFYLVLAMARFNLYAQSYLFLFRAAMDPRLSKGARWSTRLELISLVFFWSWFGAVLYGCGSWTMATMYVLVSHIVTSPLHVQVRFRCNRAWA